MVVRHSPKFTPEVLLSAPRRSAGVPNPDGSKVLFSVSTYSFETHSKSSEIRVLDAITGESTLVTASSQASNPVWLSDTEIALLKPTDDEGTELLIGNFANFKDEHYVAGVVDAALDNLKVTKLHDGSFGVAVSALSNPDGTLYYPPRDASKSHSTGRLYSSLFVRHWDKWISRQRNALWYGALVYSSHGSASYKSHRYSLSKLWNPLRGTELECPMPPFGGTSHFDISPTGLIFVSKDPNIDPAVNTKCKLFIMSMTTFREATPVIFEVGTPPILQGAMTSPVFSKDGSKAAVLVMRENGYESDRNGLLVMPDTKVPAWLIQMPDSDGPEVYWDKSPSSVQFSQDGERLYLTAASEGQVQVFTLPSHPVSKELPYQVTAIQGSVEDFKVLSGEGGTERLFVSSTSMVESSAYAIVQITFYPGTQQSQPQKVVDSEISLLSGKGSRFGLHGSQISDMWSPSAPKASRETVHSWIVKPSNFDKSKKYPLAFLIHGGPQDAWSNAWSTRWNPAIFAEQGYVCVLPNPTGSSGYGQQFCDDIKEQWGGLPYKDLEKCFEYIEENIDYIDTNRAVALGGSYGGYMVNWIQGHPLGRKFKALVTHDGVFSSQYELATDELYFVHREFGGQWSGNRRKYGKWSPSQFTENWKTPHLLIHSEKDYRLTISDALAAFNILQVQGVESQLLTFPDENHWVLNPENSLVWHETVLNFINKYAGLPPFKEGDDKEVVQDPPRLLITPSQPRLRIEKAS